MFYWGNDLDPDRINEYTWYHIFHDFGAKQVGLKLPNSFGLYDMSGNICEWCSDEYRSYVQSDGSVLDAADPKVIRGGAWGNLVDEIRSAARRSRNPEIDFIDFIGSIGFRIVLNKYE